MMKKAVSMRIIVGAGALSIKKLRYIPEKPDTRVTLTAINSIVLKLFVSRNAMAPGAINRPIDNIIPTADRVATMVREIAASIP
jgi:hypothetical protein